MDPRTTWNSITAAASGRRRLRGMLADGKLVLAAATRRSATIVARTPAPVAAESSEAVDTAESWAIVARQFA